jgi:hypothetical protein
MNLFSLLVAVAPALFVVPLDGRPVRFGAPVPAAVLAGGLRLEGRGSLQWRRLPIGRPDSDPVWIEIAISGPAGVVKVMAGGAGATGPSADGNGPVYVREQVHQMLADGEEVRQRWRFADGAVDERTRIVFHREVELGGERFLPGEALSAAAEALHERPAVVLQFDRRWFRSAGLLPPPVGGGAATRSVREQIQKALPFLVELPGARGAGDYGRSGGIVTNLEYDTTFALLRAACAFGDAKLLRRAQRAAWHLRDRDLDGSTGLPFAHGPDHRHSLPQPGHCWLQGVLWVGLLTADDDCLATARQLGRALAAQTPMGTGANERLRDYAWPLLELEALLAIEADPIVLRAADRLAFSIGRRWDPAARTFRFGEGEVAADIYLERGWLVGGLLLPALRAHLRRRPNATLEVAVAAVQQALQDRIGSGGPGLPTHWRLCRGVAFAEHREGGTATAAFVLDGLSAADRTRFLRRPSVRTALADLPRVDHPDLATELSLLLRSDWVWR